MKFITIVLAGVLALVAQSATAQTQTTTSRLFLFNPDPSDIKNSIDALEEAIKTRTNRPSKRTGLVPSTLPDKLGEPTNKSMKFGPMTVNVLECGDAYGQISSASNTQGGMLGSSGENFFGCMYVAKTGIRLSVILEQSTQSSNGLFGAVLGGIRDGIRGDDQKFGKQSFDKMVAAAREKAPGILVELMELPGGIISRPDGEQVTQHLRKATSVMEAPAVVAAGGELTKANPATASTVNPMVEARRQLSSMGLTYFSVEHFHEAITRKDTLAVQLFLQGGAVKATATNAKGQTALELAKGGGDAEIMAMLAPLAN